MAARFFVFGLEESVGLWYNGIVQKYKPNSEEYNYRIERYEKSGAVVMSDKEIVVNPSSYWTSDITPIVLSEKKKVQMVFKPMQVDNHNDLKKNIKGKLVIKKRTKDDTDFSDESKFSKKDISANESVELSLSTEETYNLAKGLFTLYRLLSGKTTNPFFATTYVEKDDRIERLKELLGNEDDLLEA